MHAAALADARMVIDFRVTGEVEAMHRDSFNLGFLGKQAITRASDIRYDEDTQLWDIHVADGEGFAEVAGAKGFSTYDEGRRMEVRWFEACRLNCITPLSTEGLAMLAVLRKTLGE
jgi:hypothetical protein